MPPRGFFLSNARAVESFTRLAVTIRIPRGPSIPRPFFRIRRTPPDKEGVGGCRRSSRGGFRSGVAQVDGAAAVAVGPNGEDITRDFGVTWEHTDSLNLNAVKVLDSEHGWAVGPKGTIARFQNRRQYLIRKENPAKERNLRAGCCLPRLAWVSTLARPSQSDSYSSPELRDSNAGRQDARHLY